MAKVDQMLDHSGTHVGGPAYMTHSQMLGKVESVLPAKI